MRQRAQILAGWSKKSEVFECIDSLQTVFVMNSLLGSDGRYTMGM